jgi:hypothetical protein
MANKYFRQVLTPDANTPGIIYEVPAANVGLLKSLRVTNDSGTRANIFVRQYSAGDATAHPLTNGFVLPDGASFDLFNGIVCVLEAGDELEVEASEDDVCFYLSYLEVDRS